MCKQCADERTSNMERHGFDVNFRSKCPFCREEMAIDDKKVGAKILKHSNRGRAWAQHQIGRCYSNEMIGKNYGIPFDKEKGLQLLKQAADQRDSDALLEIAMTFFPSERDESKHMHYLKEAADLGHPFAQGKLGDAYRSKDDKGRLHYMTLAASQGIPPRACVELGNMFMIGECGLAKSSILGKRYHEECFNDINMKKSQLFLPFKYRQHCMSLVVSGMRISWKYLVIVQSQNLYSGLEECRKVSYL